MKTITLHAHGMLPEEVTWIKQTKLCHYTFGFLS
jgi:hypothetical protein